jgi:glycosyltransferase involved in cell wall biosynthesis
VGRNVVFTGFVSEEVKIGALDASTALVLPSVKPAVASAVGEIPYRVRHNG